MPCGGVMILRHVCTPGASLFDDLRPEMGCRDCGRRDRRFMEGKRKSAVAGVFTLADLPPKWREILTGAADRGDGRCPSPDDGTARGFYYFIGKYEVTNYQWRLVMGGDCPDQGEPLTADDPRPKTEVSWFEAVDFTRRYTTWLLNNAPAALPRFTRGRPAFLRLPTEAEWEFAARGGHKVRELQINEDEIFPLADRPLSDFAVYTEPGAAGSPERMAWIGSKCANPLGLFDTAGNAGEMVLDPFHFSVGFRLHGTPGGFTVKGGSFLKSRNEVLPGRREEMPYFLAQGPFKSRDLGFRVVLSAIVTPESRAEELLADWRKAGETPAAAKEEAVPAKAEEPAAAAGQDPLVEIDRLLQGAKTDEERKSLGELRQVIKSNNIVLEEHKAETARGAIRNALFMLMFIKNYGVSRQTFQARLANLKESRDKAGSERERKNWEGLLAMQAKKIAEYDEAIDESLRLYLSNLKDSRRFGRETYQSQMKRVEDELRAGGLLSEILGQRFEILKKHVERSWSGQGGELGKEEIIKDLMP